MALHTDISASTSTGRAAEVRAAVREYLSRRERGEPISEAEFLAEYSSLQPELADALARLRIIEAAQHRVEQDDARERAPSLSQTVSASDSSLTVRCPNCHAPTSVPAAGSLSSIRCSQCGSTFGLVADETDELGPGDTLGHFELGRLLGRGGFGVVYQARDTQLDRLVAVKIPRHGRLSAGEAEQFLREARTAAQLRHPNIVSVYEVGRHEDSIYIVSEFIDGATLADRLKCDQRVTAREAALLCQKLAAALEHAHAAGVIHRDLKPGNVLIDSASEPHITDFGLARRETGEVTMTLDGVLVGTPAYMSPEQARGDSHAADARSDVYALGVILFELLTGELPFRGNVRMLTQQILSDDPPSPRKLNVTVPRDLETITLKCLEKDPARRYMTAKDVADDLGRFLRNEPIVARPIGKMARSWRWCKRNPRVAGLSAAVLGLLLTIGIAASLLAWRETIRRRAAVAQEHDTYRRLYFSDMHGAVEALADGNVGGVMDLLDRHRPQPGREDLRGFEWYYLWRQCRRGLSQRTILHGERVNSVAFSPDGSTLATGGTYNLLRLLDMPTGKQRPTVSSPVGFSVCSLAFSPDSRMLACRDSDGAKLLDATDGTLLFQTPNNAYDDNSLAFSPDGRILATSSDKRSAIELWDTTTRRLLREIDVGQTGCFWLSFSPAGDLLASVDSRGIVTMWDPHSAEKRFDLRGQSDYDTPVCFTLDGKMLVSGGAAGAIVVWDLESRMPRHTLAAHSKRISSLALSSDGKLLASASHDGTVILWDTEEFVERDRLLGASGIVYSVAFSPDMRTLAVGGADGVVRLWDLSMPAWCEILRGHESSVFSVAVSPDGNRVASGGDNILKIWDTASGKVVHSLATLTGRVDSLAFDGSGKTLAGGWSYEKIRLWDVTNGDAKADLEGHTDGDTQVVFANDATLVSRSREKLRVWDVDSRQRREFDCKPGWSAAVSSDGGSVALGYNDGSIEVRNLHTFELLRSLGTHDRPVFSVAFSRDGRSLASGSLDGTIKLWNWASGREPWTLVGHTNYVKSVAFSPDGRMLASASDDGTVRLWDVLSGEERAVLQGHSFHVDSLAFTADGRMLVSGSEDGTVRLWRAASEEEVRTAEKADANRRDRGIGQTLDPMPETSPPIPVTEADWQIIFFQWNPNGRPVPQPASWEDVVKSVPTRTVRVRAINFDWGTHAPASDVPHDYFALVATASIELAEGKYTLTTLSDDGVRVFLDGQLTIDNWTRHGPTRNIAEADVKAGKHDVRIEYFEQYDYATLQFGIFPTRSP